MRLMTPRADRFFLGGGGLWDDRAGGWKVVGALWVVGVAKVFGVWVKGYGVDSEGWW